MNAIPLARASARAQNSTRRRPTRRQREALTGILWISPWLLGFRDVLHEQSERYRRLSIRRDTAKSRDVEAEHAAIVRAVLKRDADAAVTALSKHFLTTMHLVELADAESSAGIT